MQLAEAGEPEVPAIAATGAQSDGCKGADHADSGPGEPFARWIAQARASASASWAISTSSFARPPRPAQGDFA